MSEVMTSLRTKYLARALAYRIPIFHVYYAQYKSHRKEKANLKLRCCVAAAIFMSLLFWPTSMHEPEL